MTRWQEELVEEALRDLSDWRSAHPRATFAQIEDAVEERIADLRGRLTEDLVRSRASAQGAGQDMVPLVGGVWAEVKTLAVGTVQRRERGDGSNEPHVVELSYFSRLCDAAEFAEVALPELHRRGTETAGRVCAVNDGAEWLQRFVDLYRPDAIRILDFPHAVEHLGTAAQAVFGAGTPQASEWLGIQVHELKHGDPLRVLAAVRALPAQAEQARETRDGVVSYLDKRRSQISYAEFQTAGYPIGSGIVESGNNLVVEVRLKGSGMHWLRTNVNPMLALRCALCSDRWSEAWGFIWQGLGDNGQSSVADGDRRNAPLPRMPSPSSHRPGSLLPRSRRFQNFGLKEPWSTAAPPPLIHGTAVPFHGRAVPLLRAQNFRGHPSGGGPGPFPDIQSYAVRDYGNRVGMWRLADALSKHGVRATVALNSDICRYEPEIISMGMEFGWEWMGHGRTNAERLRGLEVDAERALVQDVVQIITGATGKRPRGWLSPGRAQTENTPDLLAEAGFGLPR